MKREMTLGAVVDLHDGTILRVVATNAIAACLAVCSPTAAKQLLLCRRTGYFYFSGGRRWFVSVLRTEVDWQLTDEIRVQLLDIDGNAALFDIQEHCGHCPDAEPSLEISLRFERSSDNVVRA